MKCIVLALFLNGAAAQTGYTASVCSGGQFLTTLDIAGNTCDQLATDNPPTSWNAQTCAQLTSSQGSTWAIMQSQLVMNGCCTSYVSACAQYTSPAPECSAGQADFKPTAITTYSSPGTCAEHQFAFETAYLATFASYPKYSEKWTAAYCNQMNAAGDISLKAWMSALLPGANCCTSGKNACEAISSPPTPTPHTPNPPTPSPPTSTVATLAGLMCQNNDYVGSATYSSGMTCDAAVTSFLSEPGLKLPTAITPAVCASCAYTDSSRCTSIYVTGGYWLTTFSDITTKCCTSGLSACSVPNVCQGGAADFLPDMLVPVGTTAYRCDSYVNSASTQLYGDPPSSTNFPTSWSSSLCSSTNPYSTTTPKQTNAQTLADVATTCCQSRQSACVAKPAAATAAACFSGSDTVVLESGASLPLADVRVGDRVLTGNAAGEHSFADVVFLPHGKNTELAEFVQVTTASGKTVKATKMHLLKTCSAGLVYAGSLKQGDCLRTVDGDDAIEVVNLVVEMGLYTAVTTNEYLVVGGVVASPFAVHHGVTHAYYNLHRALYAVAPSVLKIKGLVAANALLGTTAALAYGLVATSSC